MNRKDEKQEQDAKLEEWNKMNRKRVFQQRLEPDPNTGVMFVNINGKLSSDEILEALGDRGLNADWFAGQIQEICEDESTTKHTKLRMLTLISKILSQSEGQNINISGPNDRERKEIEAEVVAIEEKLLGGTGASPRAAISDQTAGYLESGTDPQKQGSSGELCPAPEGR